MSGGGKRFNIWIVYSDLFTNLSTFLFLAALGVFAAIGSANHRPGPDEAVQPVKCDLPAPLVGPLTAGEMLKPLGPAQRRGQTCYQLFEIDGHAFTDDDDKLAAFKRSGQADGASLGQPVLNMKVCKGVWLSLGRQEFKDLDGTIVFHGIARTDQGLWPHQKRCMAQDYPPSVPNLPLGKLKFQDLAAAITRCKSSKGTGPICDAVRDCDTQPQTDRCVQAAALLDWDRARINRCVLVSAERQAASIARLCQAFRNDPEFPMFAFVQDGMSASARVKATLPTLWWRVSASGYGRDTASTAAMSDGSKMMSKLRSGAVVVELRLRGAIPKAPGAAGR